MLNRKLALLAFAAAVSVGGAVKADTTADFTPKHKGLVLVNVRFTDVIPQDGQPIYLADGTDTTLRTKITDSVVPTLGLTYFVTDNLAVDLIAGTSYHAISAVNATTNVLVQRTFVLPPTLSLQYHFLPASRFSPYVGAGVNYMWFYGTQNLNGFKVKMPGAFGASVEAGADYAVSKHVSLNVDLKKIFWTGTASIDGGALYSKVNLDPWVPSVGAGWRF
jgi:outer membrane protein